MSEPATPTTLRRQALELLLQRDADAKAAGVRRLDLATVIGAAEVLPEPPGIPGRPARPALVPHTQLSKRSARSREGRAALLHAIAHIELNAIDLALDLAWRFAGQSDGFYRDWLGVAREEALHFQLLRDHLGGLGFAYGDFPAHDALWQMAEKTKGDLLARIALVPRTLEARGLDASPPIRAKLLAAGDAGGAAILDVLLHDEVGHVALGNRWYRHLCEREGRDPIACYAELTRRYAAPRLRPPFNVEARRAAGFSDAEIAALSAGD